MQPPDTMTTWTATMTRSMPPPSRSHPRQPTVSPSLAADQNVAAHLDRLRAGLDDLAELAGNLAAQSDRLRRATPEAGDAFARNALHLNARLAAVRQCVEDARPFLERLDAEAASGP